MDISDNIPKIEELSVKVEPEEIKEQQEVCLNSIQFYYLIYFYLECQLK